MSTDEINLPADPDALRVLFADRQARIAASEQALEAERMAHGGTRKAVKVTMLQIDKLKVQLSRLRRISDGGAVALAFRDFRKCGHIERGKSREGSVREQRSSEICDLAYKVAQLILAVDNDGAFGAEGADPGSFIIVFLQIEVSGHRCDLERNTAPERVRAHIIRDFARHSRNSVCSEAAFEAGLHGMVLAQ